MAVSLPLRAQGMSCHWAFFWGQLSGMFEPVAGILGCFVSLQAQYILPYALAFAAGAMIFVVMDDIIPEVQVFSFLHLRPQNPRPKSSMHFIPLAVEKKRKD